MSESWATEEEFWGIDLKKPHSGFCFLVVENTV